MQITELINELNKAYRAASFYPPAHPAKERVLQKSFDVLQNFVPGPDDLSLTVQRKGFVYKDAKVPADQPVVVEFAGELFRRQIKYLIFQPGVSLEEFSAFIGEVARDADGIIDDGGMEKLLARTGVSHIWANEIRFDLFAKEQEEMLQETIEQDEEEDTADVDDETTVQQRRSLKEINKLALALEQSKDLREYFDRIKELRDALYQDFIACGDIYPILTTLRQISRHAASRQKDEGMRNYARDALRSMVNVDVVRFLLDLLASPKPGVKDIVNGIFRQLGSEVVPVILNRIISTPEAIFRRSFSNAIVALGDDAIDQVAELTADTRDNLVREVFYILGAIGSDKAFRVVVETINRGGGPARLEAIRSLGLFNQSAARKTALAMLGILKREQVDEGKRLVAALGLRFDEESRAALINLIKGKGSIECDEEVRIAAINQLGNDTDESTAAVLGAALRAESGMRKLTKDERVAAAGALVRVGGTGAVRELETAADDITEPDINSACWSALGQISANISQAT